MANTEMTRFKFYFIPKFYT